MLKELKATQFEWQGRTTSILDEVRLVSGVSGGSVLAAYYAAFGDATFTRFERDFLMADFQLTSAPWYGRSNVLDESWSGCIAAPPSPTCWGAAAGRGCSSRRPA